MATLTKAKMEPLRKTSKNIHLANSSTAPVKVQHLQPPRLQWGSVSEQDSISPEDDFMFRRQKHMNKEMAWERLRRLSRGSGLGKIRVRGHLNYGEIIRRFERQSTFHGISHAALAPNTKWRVIWYTAFIICFCALLIQIILLIRRYRTYAKSVDLDLKFENAPFPSVTLCNLNPYKASMIAQEERTKATMDAFSSIVQSGLESYGISAAIEAARKEAVRKPRAAARRNNFTERRYHQASAQCLCEVNSLTGERKKGSCFAAYRGNISIQFSDDSLARLHPSKCICQLDWVSKTLWPCFPYNTWKERVCKECSRDLGHCPMRFFKAGDTTKEKERPGSPGRKICLCHREYNHCIANNEYGYILEIEPKTDVSALDITEFPGRATQARTTTTTTTQTPELKQAMGFEGLTDEIAIKEQARENLMFAVGEMNYTSKVQMSQQKNELILKCSFNQKDCDIENDFKLHYDQTYGNCYTFNWNRTKQVTAHRAGANFGLRVLLYADVSEYLPTSESVGFRITVHDKWVVPFPDAFGYNAPTGFLSSFGVRMIGDFQKKFNRIPAPHGQCLYHDDEPSDFLYEGFNYSVEGCHRSCTQKEVIRICGCADPTYPIPNATTSSCKVSDPVARDCIKNASLHLGRLIAEGNLENCVCNQPCTEVNYEVTYSAARWPSGTTRVMECEAIDDLCMERYRKNAAMVQIFYEELNYETLTETPAYTLTSALADLGGLTGLWIGASVVSLLEIAALIVYTVQAYVRKRKKSVRHPNVYPPYIKRSLSSSLSSMDSIQKTSIGSKISKHSLINETEPEIEEEEVAEEAQPLQKKKSNYLPPDAELPCECVYDRAGKLQLMHALCPVHGYLVRRGTSHLQSMFFKPPKMLSGEDDDEDGKDEEEKVGDEQQEPQQQTDKEETDRDANENADHNKQEEQQQQQEGGTNSCSEDDTKRTGSSSEERHRMYNKMDDDSIRLHSSKA